MVENGHARHYGGNGCTAEGVREPCIGYLIGRILQIEGERDDGLL